MSLSKNRGEDARSSGRHELRRRIEVLFPTVEDLNAFVGDYFNEVRRQYSAEMSRIQRVNLLLEIETPAKISKSLRCFHKERQPPPPAPPPPKVASLVQVRLRPTPGQRSFELLELLETWCRDHGEEAVLLAHRVLHPEPLSNGWRRLSLQLSADAVVLDAFPALLEPGGSPQPQLRVQVPRGMPKEASYIYLPAGRGGREYAVSVGAGTEIRVALEPMDRPGRLTFELAEPADLEAHHEQ